MSSKVIRWFHVCFDTNWVRCASSRCRTEFFRAHVDHLRKCPACKQGVVKQGVPRMRPTRKAEHPLDSDGALM